MGLKHALRLALEKEEETVRDLLTNYLRWMRIPPDSEVGKFVVNQFRPKYDPDGDLSVEDVYGADAIFDFLCNFVPDDASRSST